uniref:Neuropeptide-Like Protein n=1 Tax=Ascaris lumbricoides TaxID=6252 RepID=A0A0M3IHR7_ASCLU
MGSGQFNVYLCLLLISISSPCLSANDGKEEYESVQPKRSLFGRYVWGVNQGGRGFYGNGRQHARSISPELIPENSATSPLRVRKAHSLKSSLSREFGFGKPFVYFGGFFRNSQ